MDVTTKFRAVYHFKLVPGQEERFIQAWQRTVELFREVKEGAIGSLLFQNPDDPTICFAISTWHSYEHWDRAEAKPDARPEAIQELEACLDLMRETAEFLPGHAGNLILDMTP